MNDNRRDQKNRRLRFGESQNSDGRYRYTYIDVSGKRKDVYSWRLDATDPYPDGRRRDLSLREKEKKVERNLLDQILADGGNYTVLHLVERYISLKTGVRDSTRTGYKTVVNLLKKDPFGKMRIDKVKLSDAKLWLIKLQREDGKGYSSIHSIRGVLRPAFQMAEDDDLIRKNPFGFELSTIIENDSEPREALTEKQMEEYLDFVRNDPYYSRYYDVLFILFNTGLRISEFCGLTVSDVDFDNMRLNVERQLIRTHEGKYIIEKPKTQSGVRSIPMTKEVADSFGRIILNRKRIKREPTIGGCVGFLFLDKNGMPRIAMHWEKTMQRMREKFVNERLRPFPKVTPHVCRHTFCSNMAKRGMNPKMLQYLMGHADVGVTLNTYTHIHFEDAEREMKRVIGKETA
ncbi:MAG: site-specific integrase [Ruminococcus sp.]|nr:site-specific integrase [Ruminococcus sp.]